MSTYGLHLTQCLWFVLKVCVDTTGNNHAPGNNTTVLWGELSHLVCLRQLKTAAGDTRCCREDWVSVYGCGPQEVGGSCSGCIVGALHWLRVYLLGVLVVGC